MVNVSQRRVCIIPAAGLGTRLMPLTSGKSKAMIEINGKPAICHIIETVLPFVDEIRIVWRLPDIEDFLKGMNYSIEVPIKFYKQEQATGPLDAIACAIEDSDLREKNCELLIWLSDTLMKKFDVFPARTKRVSVWTSEVPDFKRWCLLGKDGTLYDKPVIDPQTRDALIGIYAFSDLSEAADKIINRSGCEISNLLRSYGRDNLEGIKTDQWLDTGEIETLIDARGKILDTRCDNSLKLDFMNSRVTKKGDRVKNEVRWYRNVQHEDTITKFLPRIYCAEDDTVSMELITAKPLQQMFVYQKCSDDILKFVIKSVVDKYHEAFSANEVASIDCVENDFYMFIEKPLKRLGAISNLSLGISEAEIQHVIEYLKGDAYKSLVVQNSKRQIIHGDYHFGNMLYDLDTNRLWMIDPRGNYADEVTIFGNPAYDFAKLYHSCLTHYMWIVNNTPTDYSIADKMTSILDGIFGENSTFYKITATILQMTCVPLHSDSRGRQLRLWNEAYAVFKEIIV